MCDRCEKMEQRVAVLEQRLDSLVDMLHGEETNLRAALDEQQCTDLASFVIGSEPSVGASAAVRSALLEVHANWIDILENRTQQFRNRANERRAARLFARFLQKLRPEASETGVIASQDQLTMSGDRAAEIIRAEDEMPKSGVSKTVRRSFREVVRGSNPHDCQCDWEACSHGLFTFKKTANGTSSGSVRRTGATTARRSRISSRAPRTPLEPMTGLHPSRTWRRTTGIHSIQPRWSAMIDSSADGVVVGGPRRPSVAVAASRGDCLR